MRASHFVTGVSAIALLLGTGIAGPAAAGGLEDYLDDGEGYGADGPAATSDDWDKFYDQAAAQPAAPAEPAPAPIAQGPGLDDVGDAALTAAPDTGCALPGEAGYSADENATRRASLNEIDPTRTTDPCLIMASVPGNPDLEPNPDPGPGPGPNPNPTAGQSQSVLSLGALNPGSLFGGSTDNQPVAGQDPDSLLQVNVGTPDRTSPTAEGPALIEANVLDGILVNEDGTSPGALQVTVLDAINGDGTLIDVADAGPLDALGGVLALGLDPAPGAFADPEGLDGLAEVNLGDDPDGPLGFNVIQVNTIDDQTLPLANVTVADGVDDGFDSLVEVYAGDDPTAGENPTLVSAVVDQPELAGLLNTVGIERAAVLDGSDAGGATPLGDVAYIEGSLGETLSPLGIGGSADGSTNFDTGLDLLLEPLGLDSTDPSATNFASLVNLGVILIPLDDALGGAFVGEGPLGALTDPLQGILLPVMAILGGPTSETPSSGTP